MRGGRSPGCAGRQIGCRMKEVPRRALRRAFPVWRVDLVECRWYQKKVQPTGGFRNVLNLHEFFRGQFALSGLDHQTNFASPRRWRSLRAPIVAAALGAVVLLAGCNDVNPNLGAASSQSSAINFVTPSSRPAGCSGFTLDIHGEGFVRTVRSSPGMAARGRRTSKAAQNCWQPLILPTLQRQHAGFGCCHHATCIGTTESGQ